jgi:hypothetical protein
MRTQDEIQSDIRDLRRQYEALDVSGKERSVKTAVSDVHSNKRRAEILIKIKEFSLEYLSVVKANNI